QRPFGGAESGPPDARSRRAGAGTRTPPAPPRAPAPTAVIIYDALWEETMKFVTATSAALAALLMTTAVAVAEPAIVSGPAEDAQCYVPWDDTVQFFQYPAKSGPFRIALANGYIANTWRIQMIQTAKAYAAQPDVAAKLSEFKVVSTGE